MRNRPVITNNSLAVLLAGYRDFLTVGLYLIIEIPQSMKNDTTQLGGAAIFLFAIWSLREKI